MGTRVKDQISIQNALIKKVSHSMFDGIVKIIEKKRIAMKIFWSLALFVTLGTCALLLIKAVLDFLAYEVVTTITVRNEIPAKMPTIILCNTNPLMTTNAIQFASYIYSLYNVAHINNYLHFYLRQTQFPRTLNNKADIRLPRVMVMAAALEPQLSDVFRKSLGMTIEDMLISCTFNSLKCTPDNFIWKYDPYYGNCYKFNSSGSSQISQAGKFGGLSMELFVGQAVAVEQISQSNGLNIYVLNETASFNTFSGIGASTGKETTFLINKKLVKKIEKPYGECTPNLIDSHSYSSDLYRLTFEIYKSYKQKDCFNTCFQQYLIKETELGCYFVSLPYLSNSTTPACLQGLELFNSIAYFTTFFIEDVALKCSGCPLECESEFFTLTTSSLAYPTQIYADMLAKQAQILSRFNNTAPTLKQLKQSIASVNINFNELSYTQITERQKITATDLVTNIAGSISLLLGLSFLSFFDTAELFIGLFFLLIENYILK